MGAACYAWIGLKGTNPRHHAKWHRTIDSDSFGRFFVVSSTNFIWVLTFQKYTWTCVHFADCGSRSRCCISLLHAGRMRYFIIDDVSVNEMLSYCQTLQQLQAFLSFFFLPSPLLNLFFLLSFLSFFISIFLALNFLSCFLSFLFFHLSYPFFYFLSFLNLFLLFFLISFLLPFSVSVYPCQVVPLIK